MVNTRVFKLALLMAAVNGFVVVTIGAFGAHMLEHYLSVRMLEVFNTGVQYHMFHVAALTGAALLAGIKKVPGKLRLCVWLFVTGILLFSGSLYLMAITGIARLGMITPLGGLAFLAGWAVLIFEVITFDND